MKKNLIPIASMPVSNVAALVIFDIDGDTVKSGFCYEDAAGNMFHNIGRSKIRFDGDGAAYFCKGSKTRNYLHDFMKL